MLWVFFVGLVQAQCGTYQFQGVPRIVQGKMSLIVNEKTLSETIVRLRPSDEGKLAPYLNLVTKGEVKIEKIFAPRDVQAASFEALDYGVADPLNHQRHSYLRVKKSEKCL